MYLVKFIISLVLFSLLAFATIVLLRYSKAMLSDVKDGSRRAFTQRKSRRLLLKRLHRVLKRDNHNYLIFIVFEIFCNFYESNFFKEQDWDLSAWPQLFPEGKNDLTNIYKWILSIRDSNIVTCSEVGFNYSTGRVSIYDHDYPDFKFSFDKYRMLHITPVLEGEPLDYLKYKLKVERMIEIMNSHDKEVVQWILERRQHFAI